MGPNPTTGGRWSSVRLMLAPCGCVTFTLAIRWHWFVYPASDVAAIGLRP